MRNVSDKNCRENQNTRFILNTFFRKLCCLWDNVGNCGTARQATVNSIRHMRFARQITKDTDTEYAILLSHDKIGYTNAPQC